jgi:hypothetical protein
MINRPARSGDVAAVLAMVRRLLEEMATHGGHAVATGEAPWHRMADDLVAGLDDPGRCTLVAEDPEAALEDAGTHALKGVPGEWRLLRARG